MLWPSASNTIAEALCHEEMRLEESLPERNCLKAQEGYYENPSCPYEEPTNAPTHTSIIALQG